MSEDLRPKRAAELLSFLMETKKQYSQEQLAEHFGLSYKVMGKAIALAEMSGALELDSSRLPILYKYRKGATISFHTPFQFRDKPETEIDLREALSSVLDKTVNWEVVKNAGLGGHFVYALMFGMALEGDDLERYQEFLRETKMRLRNFYVAYRLAATIETILPRDRDLKKLGIPWKKDDPFVDMSLIYRDAFVDLLNALKQIQVG